MEPTEPKKPKPAPAKAARSSAKTAPAKPAAKAAEPKTPKLKDLTIDYRTGNMPEWVREVIDAHLAIEREDARKAGQLGFMSRALVIATMPYKDPKTDAFMRINGDFKLRIVAGYEGGIPYGIYPRLLMSWVTTEAVRNNSPVIELGDSLAHFLREGLELRSTGGGSRGSATRVTEQMKRLFGSLVTAQYSGGLDARGFTLRNVLIADDMALSDEDAAKLDAPPTPEGTAPAKAGDDGALWTPQDQEEAGQWRSQVRLSTNFFRECITNPVPIDLRAYKSLRGNPLAMDVYTWLTYRMSYTTRRSRPIPWEALMMQFGSGYGSGNTADPQQGVRDFKKAFLRALKLVGIVYPDARVDPTDAGLVLAPSKTHIPRSTGGQGQLF